MITPDRPRRLADWRPRLSAYLNDVARASFRPGKHDCALFAAGAVQAMTDVDLASAYRGTYRSLAAGQEALQSRGFADHIAFVEAVFPAVAPALAQVGDLAVMPSAVPGERGALGIFQGAGVYVLRPSGLVVADRLSVERAFSV
ncbi:DUF6950 family protein [Epibacterium sp. Ofav1-8]|uniref:DUF6950 family protein n=1 Tax=Epibacterium sp. Ofav1-8 TaxID=2917735 RepID=UPI001EF674E7|nr:hypothetical protein [Epibacterium sp. Ofav1-8]MCG7626059.1 hypothetical protein [Epibacterium sp. Ofav1-8]